MNETIFADLQANKEKVIAVREFLHKLYYDPEFSTLFNRPVLSMLESGCDYLEQNLELLKTKLKVS